jgi:pre-mRNA-processing factor 39
MWFCNRLKALIAEHALSEIQTAEEKAAQEAPPAVEGEEAPGNEPAKTEAELKAEYLASREALFKATEEEKKKVKQYEEAILRPYFHVKALDESQISNWHKYLDYVEKEMELPKVSNLFLPQRLLHCAGLYVVCSI